MKYDVTMLDNNLNEQIGYADFFKALGYSDREEAYIRTFYDPGDEDSGHNMQVEVSRFDSIIPTLRRENTEKRGVFYVVNGNGHKDSVVKAKGKARACFIDGDEDTLEEQLRALSDFPLEPSIIIRTRKSLHAYWITPDGEIKYFRELQERLIKHFKSDPSIKNESRVMRLYGFNHCKEEPIEVRLIKFDPQLVYTQRQLHEVLPLLEKPATPERKAQKKAEGEIVPHGKRFRYVVEQIGHYVAKLPDASESIIMETVYADFLENCEQVPEDSREEFERRFMPAIRKFKAADEASATDPAFNRFAMKAWKRENPNLDYDTSGASWAEVVAAGLRAKVEEMRIDEGIKNHIEDTNATDPAEEDTPNETNRPKGILTPEEEIDAFLDDILTDRYEPIPTGIKSIDDMLQGGLIRQEIVTLTAAPGMGKTTLCQQIAEAMAENGHKILYYNLEMSKEQMLARSFARIGAAGLTPLEILQAYKLTPEQLEEVKRAATRYKRIVKNSIEYNPMYFDTEIQQYAECDANLDHIILSMRQAAARAKKDSAPVPIVFIDYLHLLRSAKDEDAATLLKRAMELFKDFARRCNTLVFVIAANNRSANREGRAGMDTARDTSAIEYSGDIMLSLNYKLTDSAGGQTAQEVTEKIQEFREQGKKLPIEYRLYSLRVTKSRFTEANARTILEFDGAHSKFASYSKAQAAFKASRSEASTPALNEPEGARGTVIKMRTKREHRRQDLVNAYNVLKDTKGGATTLKMADYLGVSQATVKRNVADLCPGMFELDGVTQEAKNYVVTKADFEEADLEQLPEEFKQGTIPGI